MSKTTEDYLKRILAEREATGKPTVGLGRLATLAGVTPGTVTTMMKSLAEAGLVTYVPRRGVRLTEKGHETAMRILRRHRLIELFLVEILELDWAAVHSEAEVLEHAVSDRIVDRIDEMLGYPTADPHGDPIPVAGARGGRLQSAVSLPLSEAIPGTTCAISRIGNDEPSFLDYLKRSALMPGKSVEVIGRDEEAGTVEIEVDGNRVVLSLPVASRIGVTVA